MIERLNLYSFTNLIRNKSFQNFIFLATIQASNILISLISIPILIQSIGVDQFGLVNLALSVIVLCNILVGFGYNLSAPREVAINHRDKESLSHLVSNIIGSKVLMAFLATLGIGIAIFGFGMFKEYQWILLFSVLLLFSEATLPLWFFQGMEKMKLISIANIVSKLLYLMGLVLFIYSPEQAKWVNFIMGGAGLGINMLLLLYIHYQLNIKFYKPKFIQLFTSLHENGLLFLSNLASHISINGGLIILSFFSTAEILGMFSLAERVSMVLRIFPALVIQAIYPFASKLLQSDRLQFIRFIKKVYGISLLLGLLASLTTFALAPYIIQVLSKSELEESVIFMKILAFLPFLACLNIANVTIFLVKDQKDLMFKSSWLMFIYMISASLILTSQFGALGLCYALLSTEIIVLLISSVLNWIYNKPLVLSIAKTF